MSSSFLPASAAFPSSRPAENSVTLWNSGRRVVHHPLHVAVRHFCSEKSRWKVPGAELVLMPFREA